MFIIFITDNGIRLCYRRCYYGERKYLYLALLAAAVITIYEQIKKMHIDIIGR